MTMICHDLTKAKITKKGQDLTGTEVKSMLLLFFMLYNNTFIKYESSSQYLIKGFRSTLTMLQLLLSSVNH